MAADQHWSKRTLKAKIDGMLYERTALAKQPEEVIRRDLELLRNERKMSPDIAFHDPYFLAFLGLEDDFSEKDLESAIVSELQKFITEVGNDFAFMVVNSTTICTSSIVNTISGVPVFPPGACVGNPYLPILPFHTTSSITFFS